MNRKLYFTVQDHGVNHMPQNTRFVASAPHVSREFRTRHECVVWLQAAFYLLSEVAGYRADNPPTFNNTDYFEVDTIQK